MNPFTYHTPILGYHRVGPVKGDHVPTVSAHAFERQLSFLTRHHVHVATLDEVVASLDRGEPFPRRSVVITFDDGYEETYTVAWPLLQRWKLSATLFIAPAEVGLPGFVTWQQLAEMAKDGMTIGSHTMHHAYLPLLSPEGLQEELIESKRVIEQRIGLPVQFVSYPVGGFTPQAQESARQAGYLAAFTTNRTASRSMIDRYALRRIKVTERDSSPMLFWAKVSGYYDGFRRLKDPS